MKRINISEVYKYINAIMGEAINQYGPVTNPEDYQWVIGIDVIKAIDAFLCLTDAPRDTTRTLLGIDIRIHMNDPTIIQLHRIIATDHLDIDA